MAHVRHVGNASLCNWMHDNSGATTALFPIQKAALRAAFLVASGAAQPFQRT